MNNPSVCVVVAIRNRLNLTKRFLEAFQKSTYKNYKIVIVDDDSSDGSYEYITENFPETVLIKGNGDLWWTGATNEGVKYAIENNFDYVLTINNDSVPSPELLASLVGCAIKTPNSLIGSVIYRSDTKKIWSLGGHLDWNGRYLFVLNNYDDDPSILKNLQNPYPVEILNGNGTLIPVSVFKKIGLYNVKYTPHYHADSEIVLRASKFGYKAYICLDAHLINEISDAPIINGRFKLIFWKKSDYFWKPLLYFYLKYGPKTKILNFFKQYLHFFQDIRLVRGIYKLQKFTMNKLHKKTVK